MTRPISVLSVVGARPQFIKLAPISRAFAASSGRVEHIIAHTGQHYDHAMSDVFFEELGLPAASVNLGVGSGPHGKQTAAMLESLEQTFLDVKPRAVIVYGDTNSTLAGALAAVKLHIPLAHVEAGLRSFNRDMPEEINRIAADHVADLLLAPTATGMQNLANEGLAARATLSGDVMLDTVEHFRPLAASRDSVSRRHGLDGQRFALVTLHRAENTTRENLLSLLESLNRVAAEIMPLLFLVHPRTVQALKTQAGTFVPHASLKMAEPVGYLDMLRLLDDASAVLTDSGGLQKEAFFSGCPCVTLRRETEWVETVSAGANRLVGSDAAAICDAARWAIGISDPRSRARLREKSREYFGSGHAASIISERVLALAEAGHAAH